MNYDWKSTNSWMDGSKLPWSTLLVRAITVGLIAAFITLLGKVLTQ